MRTNLYGIKKEQDNLCLIYAAGIRGGILDGVNTFFYIFVLCSCSRRLMM